MLGKTFTAAAAVVALLPFTSAVGVATVENLCAHNICVYTTTPGGGSITHTYQLTPGGSQAIPYPANGMVGSQVRVSPSCSPNNIVYWEFAQGNNIIYYDVNINGPTADPFKGGLSVNGTTASCPRISCAKGGSTACFNNPNGVPQNQVKACTSNNSIYFNACRP